jgi:hypothetical protein
VVLPDPDADLEVDTVDGDHLAEALAHAGQPHGDPALDGNRGVVDPDCDQRRSPPHMSDGVRNGVILNARPTAGKGPRRPRALGRVCRTG